MDEVMRYLFDELAEFNTAISRKLVERLELRVVSFLNLHLQRKKAKRERERTG